jgi:redox-sensing transcriptional repressor
MIQTQTKIPEPTVRRLIQIASLLKQEIAKGKSVVSSSQIGKELGVEANTIRKDINMLGGAGDASSGYHAARLAGKIEEKLGLQLKLKACIIGLGRLGEALINYPFFHTNGIDIVAAFDVNINKLETLKTDISLHPAYEMEDVIKIKNIEVAILAVPLDEVEKSMAKLLGSGIKGILNYTGAILPHRTEEGIYIRNLDITGEMNMLKVLLNNRN